MIYADYAPSDQERELVERAFNPETAVLPEVIAETSPSPSGE
jgi:hypothetical protein